MICSRCHRPLRLPTATGMGPVCTRLAKQTAPKTVERDLFGFDIDRAVLAALSQLALELDCRVAQASQATKEQYRQLRSARWERFKEIYRARGMLA